MYLSFAPDNYFSPLRFRRAVTLNFKVPKYLSVDFDTICFHRQPKILCIIHINQFQPTVSNFYDFPHNIFCRVLSSFNCVDEVLLLFLLRLFLLILFSLNCHVLVISTAVFFIQLEFSGYLILLYLHSDKKNGDLYKKEQ